MTAIDISLIVYVSVGIIVMFVVGTWEEVQKRRRDRGPNGLYRNVDDDPPLLIGFMCGVEWPLGIIIAAGFAAYAPIWLTANLIDRRDARAARRRADAALIADLERELLSEDA